MLSNTAIPKYYGAFRERVLSGEEPVCQKVALQMNRIDSLIADPNMYYDDEAIDGFINFCEDELTLTDGTDLKLLESFKLWAEDLLSWFYYIEKSVYTPNTDGRGGRYIKKRVLKRLCKKQYLVVARGAAKSMYVSFIQNYFLNVFTDTTHQITVAPTMRQADEVMSPIRTSIIRARGPLFKFLTEGSLQNTTGSKANRKKLTPTKKGIENFITGSLLEIRPMSVDKLQGLRTYVSSVDEWLSTDIREDVIGAIEQGASKLDGYIILAVSSEGTVRNGVGDTIKMELNDILNGKYYAPHVSIWHYQLDSLEEINDPFMWIKANPNLGKTVQYDVYQEDLERSEKVPSSRNDIIAKRFGIPMEGYTYFFSYEDIQLHKKRTYRHMYCALGADLSQGDDFCAFSFLFPLNTGEFGVKNRSYITERTLNKLPLAMRYKYEEFINEGTLIIMSGSILNMSEVFDDIMQHIIDMDYTVVCFGYDPYGSTEFIEKWTIENGPYNVNPVRQGVKTESIPLGEIKKLAEDRLLLFDELIMNFTMGNAITIEDNNGNRKLLKKRQDRKIDNVASLMDAFVSYKLNKDSFD